MFEHLRIAEYRENWSSFYVNESSSWESGNEWVNPFHAIGLLLLVSFYTFGFLMLLGCTCRRRPLAWNGWSLFLQTSKRCSEVNPQISDLTTMVCVEPMNVPCSNHIETCQVIYYENQLTNFYMMRTQINWLVSIW